MKRLVPGEVNELSNIRTARMNWNNVLPIKYLNNKEKLQKTKFHEVRDICFVTDISQVLEQYLEHRCSINIFSMNEIC